MLPRSKQNKNGQRNGSTGQRHGSGSRRKPTAPGSNKSSARSRVDSSRSTVSNGSVAESVYDHEAHTRRIQQILERLEMDDNVLQSQSQDWTGDLDIQDISDDGRDFGDSDDDLHTPAEVQRIGANHSSDVHNTSQPSNKLDVSAAVVPINLDTARTNGHSTPSITSTRELVSLADVEVGSDEERETIRRIRAEVLGKVREGMQDEIRAIRNVPETPQQPEAIENGDEDMDPELKAAIIKMRKLDKILNRRIKKEREIKRDRLQLQRRLRAELEALRLVSENEGKEARNNTNRFIALVPSSKHNKGVNEEPSPPQTPLFKTQLGDADYNRRSAHSQKSANQNGAEVKVDKNERDSSRATDRTDASSSKRGGKDFIKRNIELAKDADAPVAMTDEEKQRVHELLADLDSLPEIPDDVSESTTSTLAVNPYHVTAEPGEGFTPEPSSSQQLMYIDSRLRSLLPPSEYESIAYTPRTVSEPQHSERLFSRLAPPSVLDDGPRGELYGEAALREVRQTREQQLRMREIEERLAQNETEAREPLDSPRLDNNNLQSLLDQCVVSLSARPGTDLTHDGESSVAFSVYDDPPKLQANTLQRLLEQAREEGVTSTHVPYDPSQRINSNRGEPESLHKLVMESEYGNQSLEPCRSARDVIGDVPTQNIQSGTEERVKQPAEIPGDGGEHTPAEQFTGRSSALSFRSTSPGSRDLCSRAERYPTGSARDPDFYLPRIAQKPQLTGHTPRDSRASSRSSTIDWEEYGAVGGSVGPLAAVDDSFQQASFEQDSRLNNERPRQGYRKPNVLQQVHNNLDRVNK